LIVGDNFDEESGYIGAKILLGGSNKMTAIFAVNNFIALGSIKAIQEEKLRIPDDISILSFDDQTYYNYFSTPLSSIAQQTKEIGQIAYKILADMIDKKATEQHHKIYLPTQLIIRESIKDIRVLSTS
jgi:LacI family transcriptional regulator